MNIKLSEIVGMALDQFNLGKHEYARFYRFAIRGLRNLNWDVTGTAKEVPIPVSCDLTAPLPDDFLKEIKVGVAGPDGQISALTRNNNLSLNGIESCDRFVHYDIYKHHYRRGFPYGLTEQNSYGIGRSLGIGSHANIGEFKIDMDCGQIVLSPDFCYDCIILQYLSNTDTNGEMSVHEFAMEALLAFIEWKYKVGSPKFSQGDRILAQQNYFKAKTAAKMRLKAPILQDLNQAARTSVKSGMRR